MAQKTIVTVVDDLTGEESDEIHSVEFTLDGVGYVIDLTDKNAQQLRDALSAYVAAARRVGGRQRGRGRQPRSASGARASSSGYNRETQRAIRQWARQHGHTVSDRGRLPASVVKAWEDQHESRPTARRRGPPDNTTRTAGHVRAGRYGCPLHRALTASVARTIRVDAEGLQPAP